MRLASIIICTILLFFWIAGAQADVDVAIPDTSAFPGDTLLVLVRVSDLTELEIYSYQFNLSYDSSVVQALGVDSTGTLTQMWGSAVVNMESPGVIKLGNYGTTALSNAGILVYLKFALIGEINDSTQLNVEDFEFNDANPAAIVSDGSIKIMPPPISISFELNVSADLEFFIDGIKKSFPFDTTWSAGSVHTISTSSPQNVSENTRYVFFNWSDGADMSHTISPTTETTFTLFMNKEYLLTINSDHGNTQGDGWYAEGSDAAFSADSLVFLGDSTRFVFNGWTGEGPGSYTGMQRTKTITVNGPVTETAGWKTQFYVEIESQFGSPVGEGWHEEGATADIGIDSLTSFVEGTRYVFDSWIGTGEGSYTGADRLTQVFVSNPIKEIANWRTEFYFDVNSNPVGLVSFEKYGWYAKNAVANSDTAKERIWTSDKVYRFQFWQLDGEQVVTNPIAAVMDTSHAAEAIYEIDSVQVNISSAITDNIFISVDDVKQGLPYEDFWAFQSGHVVSIDTTQFNSDSTIRYLFETWSTSSDLVQTLTADSVLKIMVNLSTEFYLSVETYPAGLIQFQENGWYQPDASVQLPTAEDFIIAGSDTFYFRGWQLDGIPLEENPVTVTMDQPHEVVALYMDLYSISGVVFDSRENMLEGVKLILSGVKEDTLFTTGSGKFNFNYLVAGSYRVTPLLEGFEFTPEYREYSSLDQVQLDQNFTGTDIEKPLVQLLSPNGGEQFQGASMDTILWSASYNVGIDSVIIELSVNNGNTWERLAALSTSLAEKYIWNVSDINSTFCKIKIWAIDFDGNVSSDESDNSFTIIGNSQVETNPVSELPSQFFVEQNYPNPFNNTTIIPFQLPKKTSVAIRIFNMVGQEILLLRDQEFPAGSHRIAWNGKSANGKEMSSGIYFYSVEAMGRVFTRRLLYIR